MYFNKHFGAKSVLVSVPAETNERH